MPSYSTTFDLFPFWPALAFLTSPFFCWPTGGLAPAAAGFASAGKLRPPTPRNMFVITSGFPTECSIAMKRSWRSRRDATKLSMTAPTASKTATQDQSEHALCAHPQPACSALATGAGAFVPNGVGAGEPVGTGVGKRVGRGVGDEVGCGVGLGVGGGVGKRVGYAVGDRVGDAVCPGRSGSCTHAVLPVAPAVYLPRGHCEHLLRPGAGAK